MVTHIFPYFSDINAEHANNDKNPQNYTKLFISSIFVNIRKQSLLCSAIFDNHHKSLPITQYNIYPFKMGSNHSTKQKQAKDFDRCITCSKIVHFFFLINKKR